MSLAVLFARSSEGNALVHGDVVAHDGGFADDDGGAVIDEKAMADLGAGVNFDEGKDARDLRKEAGEEAEAVIPERVVNAMKPERVQAGIAEEYFEVGARGWVPLADGADIVTYGLEDGGHAICGPCRVA